MEKFPEKIKETPDTKREDFQKLFSELEIISKEKEFNAQKYLNIFEQKFPNVYEKPVGVWENYSLKEHTLMVMNQFEKYFSNKEIPIINDKEIFRFFLAIHDLGKPFAVEKKETQKQHEYTLEMISPLLEQSPFDERKKEIIKTLIDQDIIGDFIKLDTPRVCALKIFEFAKKNNLTPEEALDVLKIFYFCDAGSYTEDANGKKSLDYLFTFNPKEKTMSFSRKIEAKIQLVKDSFPLLRIEIETEKNKIQKIKDILSLAREESKQITIKPEDRNKEGKLLALPNGPESHLSEENWKLDRTSSFKEWFGDWQQKDSLHSDIVDENGEPALVYHTTNASMDSFEGFSEEEANKQRDKKNKKAGSIMVEDGYYFTAGEYEYGNNRLSVFIKARVKKIEKHGDIMNLMKNQTEKFKKNGFTGVIHLFNETENRIQNSLNAIKKEYRRKYLPKSVSDKIFYGFNRLNKKFNNLFGEEDIIVNENEIKFSALRALHQKREEIKEFKEIKKNAKSPFFEVCVFDSEQIMIVDKEENYKKN